MQRVGTGLRYTPGTMKPHPRIRKTIKWGGAVVTVVLVVVWVLSQWWQMGWTTPHGWGMTVSRGALVVSDTDQPWGDLPRALHFREAMQYRSGSSPGG